MNNKTQFFIIGILIFSMALTSIFYLLSIPSELSKKSLQSQTMDYNDFYNSLKSIKELSRFMTDYWLKNYHEQALIFSVKNNGFNEAINQELIINLEIDNPAIIESFYLSSNKENPEFSIIKLGEKNYLLNFKEDLSINEEKEYSLLFSLESDDESYFRQEKKLSNYYDQDSSIFYESNNYLAVINKNTGEISSLKLPGTAYETINGLGAKINSSEQSLCSSAYNFMSYINNVLTINFTCELESINLTQVYSFAPKFFSIYQNFEIKSEGNHNLSYYADSVLSSMVTEIGINESLSQPTPAKYDSRYVSMFSQDKGLLFINNDSKPYISSPNIYSEFRINQETFTIGNYSQSLIIMPYYNNYTYSLITANNYFTNPINQLLISKDEFLKRFKYSFSSILSNNFNILTFNASALINEDLISSKSKESSNSFSEFSLKNSPLLNKTLIDESGNELSFSFNTKNYARNSTIPVSFCNNESLGITNTTFEFMKIIGNEIIISINTTAEINASLYDYYWQSLANETILSNSNMSVNNELNGLYRLVIYGENACFSVSVNCPLISAKTPAIINNSGSAELFFQSKDSFTLEKTNLEAQANLILSNPSATLINSSNDLSQLISINYYSPINYYLNLTSAGKFYLSNDLNLGAEESYLSNDYEITGAILKDFESIEYYIINESLPKNYCLINYSNNILNNTDYSIDFENQYFNVSGINWASSQSLFGIDDSVFNYSGIILDSCLIKSLQFDSENASLILNAINNSKLFALDIEDANKNFDLKINIKINGDADNYYLLNSKQSYFETLSSTNSKNLNNNYNFFGKNDSGTIFGIIFDSNDLVQSSNALTAHNDYLKISLSKNAKRIYLYFTNDYYDLLRTINGINNNPSISNELLAYNYSFIGQTFKSNGTLFG